MQPSVLIAAAVAGSAVIVGAAAFIVSFWRKKHAPERQSAGGKGKKTGTEGKSRITSFTHALGTT